MTSYHATEHTTGQRPVTAPWWRSRWVAPAAATVIALVFIFENTESTEIRLLVPVVTTPLWAALLIVWLLGVFVGLFFARRRRER